MLAINELNKEHEGIMQMLLILETVAGRLERQETVPIEDLEGMVEFLSVFVDLCHHGKEEEYLFPAMEDAGLPQQGHPIETLLAEHKTMRELTAALKKSLDGIRAGDDAANLAFAETVSQYMDLLELHIEKERTVLFPLAEKHLDPGRDAELMTAFAAIERERVGPDRHGAFQNLLKRLKKNYPT